MNDFDGWRKTSSAAALIDFKYPSRDICNQRFYFTNEAAVKPLRSAIGSETLRSGGGNGTFADMEERIARLELMAEDAKSTLNTIMGQLGRMDAKLDSKPIRVG